MRSAAVAPPPPGGFKWDDEQAPQQPAQVSGGDGFTWDDQKPAAASAPPAQPQASPYPSGTPDAAKPFSDADAARFTQPAARPTTTPQLPNATIGPAPAPGIFERARESVANSIIGHSLEQATPGIAQALHLQPTESEDEQRRTGDAQALPQLPRWATSPLVPAEDTSTPSGRLASQESAAFRKAHPIAGAVIQGLSDTVSGLSSPENLALLAATPEAKPIMALFSAQAAKGAYQSAEQAYQAFRQGNNPAAAKFVTESGLNVVIAALAGYSALHGAFPVDTARPTVATPDVEMPTEPLMLPAPRAEGAPEAAAAPETPPAAPAPAAQAFRWDDQKPSAPAAPTPQTPAAPPLSPEMAQAEAMLRTGRAVPPAETAPGIAVPPPPPAAPAAPVQTAPSPEGQPPAQQSGAPQGQPQGQRPAVQASGEPADLRKSAQDQKPVLEQAAQQVAAAVPGVEVVGPRVKSADSIENKDDRGKPPETNIDNLGVRVVAPSPDAVPAVQQAIESQLPVVSKEKITSNGVNADQYGIRTGEPGDPNQVSELQVTTKLVAEAMKATDDLYDQQKAALARREVALQRNQPAAAEREQKLADMYGAQIQAKMEEAQQPENQGRAVLSESPEQVQLGNPKPETPAVQPGFDVANPEAAAPFKPGDEIKYQTNKGKTRPGRIVRVNGNRALVQDSFAQVWKPLAALNPVSAGQLGEKIPAQIAQPAQQKTNEITPARAAAAPQPAPGTPPATGDKWIGVDLDGTLAKYDGFKGKTAIGKPIPAMVDRIKQSLDDGNNVKILTARVSDDPTGEAKKAIQDWTEKPLGKRLDVTDVKDSHMIQLYDDRAVSVERNTGKLLAEPQPERGANANEHQRTYEEVQKDIDRAEDELEKSGQQVTKLYFPEHAEGPGGLKNAPGWKPMPEHLVKLYAERDAIGSGQLRQSIAEITNAIKKAGITDEAEIRRVLEYYALDAKRTDAAKQYMASEYTMETVNRDPKRQAEDIYSSLAPLRDVFMDDRDDLWRDRALTRDSIAVVKGVVSYFHGGKAPEIKGLLPEGNHNANEPGNGVQPRADAETGSEGSKEDAISQQNTATVGQQPGGQAGAGRPEQSGRVEPKQQRQGTAGEGASAAGKAKPLGQPGGGEGPEETGLDVPGVKGTHYIHLEAHEQAKTDRLQRDIDSIQERKPTGTPFSVAARERAGVMDRPARTDAIGKPGVEVPAKYEPKPNESPKVEPKPKSTETSLERFKRAVQAKADKYLDTQVRREGGQVLTRRAIIEDRMADGGTTSIKQVEDDAATRKLDRELGAMRRAGVPSGNQSHPTTIKYNELKAQQKTGIKVPSYRITGADGTEWIVPKTEYDYAKSIEGKTLSPAEPEPKSTDAALASGKTVPPEVLADYPELGPKVQEKALPAKGQSGPAAAIETGRTAKTPEDAYSKAVEAYREHTPVKEQDGYNTVLNGLSAYLEKKGLEPRTDYLDRAKETGASPLLWELSTLFHSPLAGAKGTETPEELGKQMEWYLPKDDDPLNHKVDRLGTNWNFNDDQGVTHMRNYMEREFKRDLDQAQSSVDAGKRKAEIVSAIIGDTAKTKAVDNLAANIQKNIDETKAYAESQLAKAEKREAYAKAAEDRLPITRAEHMQPLEAIRLKPKEAWGADKARFMKGKNWISDGHIALSTKDATKAGQKALDKLVPTGDGQEINATVDQIYSSDKAQDLEPLGALTSADSGEKNDLAFFTTPKGDLIAVSAHKLRLVENIYGKDGLTFKGKGGKNSIAAMKGGKPVAIIMPFQSDPGMIDVPTAKNTMAAGGYKEADAQQAAADAIAQAKEKYTEIQETQHRASTPAENPIGRPSSEGNDAGGKGGGGLTGLTPRAKPAAGSSGKVEAKVKPSDLGSTTYAGGFLDPELFKVLFPDVAQRFADWVTEAQTPGATQREMMRETRGERDRMVSSVAKKLQATRNKWTLRSRADSMKFWNAVESGNVASLPTADQPLAQVIQNGFKPLIQEIQDLKPQALQTLIENYFPHIWEQPSMAAKTVRAVMSGRRPFAGSGAFLKQRTVPTMQDGIDMGLKPVSWNPVDLFLRKYAEMSQFLMAHKTLEMMKDAGTAKMVRVGRKAPEGWRQLDDRIGTVYGRETTINPQKIEDATYDKTYAGGTQPTPSVAREDIDEAMGQATVIRGHYYAPPEAAKVFNRFLSTGLSGHSAFYDVLRWTNNNLNALQLGISAFHASTTAVNAATSEVALGIQQLSEGKPIQAAGHLLSGAAVAPAVLRTLVNGSRMMQEYLDPGSYKKFAAEASAVAEAGGRAKMDLIPMSAFRKTVNAFRNRAVGEGLLSLPGTVLQSTIAPVMDWLVPRMKLGAFYDMAHNVFDEAGRNNWDEEEVRRRMQRAWDSVDNRFGQLVYDNLFWHRALQDTLMLASRSVGWNYGDLRELGGGMADVGKQAAGVFTGKKPEVTPRMAFAFALPLVTGLIGAALTYLWTGKGPDTWKDYFYPKRQDGTRVSIPGYMKDVVGFAQHPVSTVTNKMSPLLEMTAEAIQNRDFYGTEIRHKDDPYVKQLLQVSRWAAASTEPFALSGAQKLLAKEGEDTTFRWAHPVESVERIVGAAVRHPGDLALGQLGFQPAPAFIQNSKALNMARQYGQENRPSGTKTQAQADKTQAMHAIEDMYRSKQVDQQTIAAYKNSGVVNEIDILRARLYARTDPLTAAVSSLSPEQALNVYTAATPDEQKTLRPLIELKGREIDNNTAPDQREQLKQAYHNALNPQPKFKPSKPGTT